MKLLMLGLAISLGVSASDAKAVEVVTVDGTEFPLSILMGNCKSMSEEPEAMIACFAALSALLEKQSGGVQKDDASVAKALDDLRAVAQYQDDDTGLFISGTDCMIQTVYYGNYYHLSRRNVSTIDLFSAKFDASKLQYDQIAEVPGVQVPLLKGMMDVGATATMSGGMELESTQQNFEAKSARSTIYDYANEVVAQLPVKESQAFEFVLVHPQKRQASADILSAFKAFASLCKG